MVNKKCSGKKSPTAFQKIQKTTVIKWIISMQNYYLQEKYKTSQQLLNCLATLLKIS